MISRTYASAKNLRFVLYIRQDTILSDDLEAAQRAGTITVDRRLP